LEQCREADLDKEEVEKVLMGEAGVPDLDLGSIKVRLGIVEGGSPRKK